MTRRSRWVVGIWLVGCAVALALAQLVAPPWLMTVLVVIAAVTVGAVYVDQRPERVLAPGEWGVRLVDAGPKRVQVVKELRAVELDLREAHEATQSTPVVVVRGVSREVADGLVAALRRHEAQAEVVGAEA